MNIRSVTTNDAERILEIYAPSILNSFTSFETQVPNPDEMRNRIKELTLKFPWLVCELEGRVVGYAYGSTYRSRSAYQWSAEVTVYIDEQHFGKGLGKALYNELFLRMKNQGIVNVFAGIALPNLASVRLHESLGFLKVGEFKDVGFKLGKWHSVGWWQMQLEKPACPSELLPPVF